MDIDSLRALKKGIDSGFRGFTREYGVYIENAFEPLKQFLIYSEKFMLETPWPLIILLIAGIAWFASRNRRIVIGTIVTLLLIDAHHFDDFRVYGPFNCYRHSHRHCHVPI